jgi:outer membrane protein OmpA-like peptidoglycan-associated protein
MYNIAPVIPNKDLSNFGMVAYENGYVFCSEQPADGTGKANPWNGRPYLNIMYTKSKADGTLETPVPFSESLSTPYHNGPMAFSPSFDRIYFSASGLNEKNKLEKGSSNVNNIKLYTAKRSGNEWVEIAEMPFNSNDYSCGQPAVSADGKKLFFVSDMPGGRGKSDMYECDLVNGQWSQPRNMGSNFNTPGHEMFPYYYRDDKGHSFLYFSSDGMAGMGGLDIYCCEQMADGSWGKPIHLGAPFNSPKDDFGMVMTKDGKSGFFSSARGGNGDVDQVYSFSKVPPKLYVEGTIYNKMNHKPVNGASIRMNNKKAGTEVTVQSEDNGKFVLPVDPDGYYTFFASMDRFAPDSTDASTAGKEVSEIIPVALYLNPEIEMPTFANVYFDFDKSAIRKDAEPSLDQLAEMLIQDKDIKIKFGAHADERGTDQYNMKLSEKRARSIEKYLLAKGVSADQIRMQWHGKQLPTFTAASTDEQHQMNRRAEFVTIEQPSAINMGTPNVADVNIYPDKKDNIVSVEVSATLNGNMEVEVRSMDGKKVKSVTAAGSKAQFDTSDLPNGCYMISCYYEKARLAAARYIKN